MSATHMEPLPNDYLSSFGPHEYRAAINARNELLQEVFQEAGEHHDLDRVTSLKGATASAKAQDLRKLNDELARLEESAAVVQSHPGHHGGPRSRSNSRRDGSKFGRVGLRSVPYPQVVY